MAAKKFALIHMGSDEVYGMEFVAAEILKHGHEFEWFDGDFEGVVKRVAGYAPDFVCFSPLTTFFNYAVQLSRNVKELVPNVRSVFGGHHVSAVPDVIGFDEVDTVVVGPVYGTIDPIVGSGKSEVIKGQPVLPEQMFPARREYFKAIPRIGGRHRKCLMTHFGCAYNCSYCSASRVKKEYGSSYKKYFLTRRPIKDLIEESKVFLEFPTVEVCIEDDDILYGLEIEGWLSDFLFAWKKEINLPVFGNVTPNTVVHVSDRTLDTLANLVDTVTMGIQAARPESLKLFNRQFQKQEQVKQAFDRLKSFSIPTKLELIIGLPVADPVCDAIESIRFAQRIGAGTFAAAFPLMLYPGTALYDWCKKNNYRMNEDCSFEWYSGIGSLRFDAGTTKKLRNLSQLATFFVKYNVDERWMRALIEMDFDNNGRRAIAECNYLESLVFRQGEEARENFDEVLAKTAFRF